MSPAGRGRRGGFALLPVVLALSLVGATAYLMTRAGASGVALVASAQQTDRARYVAEAALRHAIWQVQASNCSGYSDVATKSFGAGSYSATVEPDSGSPIAVKAVGTLADGTSYELVRSGERAYATPSVAVLQLGSDPGEDTLLDSFYDVRNYGGVSYLQVNSASGWIQRPLIRFDLSSLPAGVEVISARLELKQWHVVAPGVVSVHRVARDWVEGTKTGGGTADGTNWPTFDGTQAWAVPGGDFDPAPASEARVSNATNNDWMGWELAELVEGWLADPASNHGMLLRGEDVLREAEFASREASNPADAPRLSVVYACECGKICGAVGTRVLYVVSDPAGLTAEEGAREALMQGWGFAVTRIDDDATEEEFDTETANHDVAYISQEAVATALGSKLNDTAIGVVNESKDMIDDFGFTTGLSMGGGLPTLDVDPDHYITSVFASSPISPYVANDWYQIADEPVAPGVDPVGSWVESPWTGKPALMALSKGDDLSGGGTAAGHRVQIPWGSGQGATPVALASLSDDALTIVERSIDWAGDSAGGSACGSTTPLLLVVSDTTSPTAQEAARQTLLESWCYAVTRIDDDATSLEFAEAMALNDVIYISQEITTLEVVTKLKNATIGVVSEHGDLIDDFGMASGSPTAVTLTDASIIDNVHYITDSFPLGDLTLASPWQPFTYVNAGVAAGVQLLADVFNKPSLLVADTGAELLDSTPAPGRRVQLPWGSDGFDINALNIDGLKLMQRAVEWAAGAGCGSLQDVLLVVGDDSLPLASHDAGRLELIETGCFRVSLINDGETQTNFDTAIEAADVVFASGTSSGPTLLDKLTGADRGVVNEVNGKLDNFGFSSSTGGTLAADSFAKTDAAHYISEPFGGESVTALTTALSLPVPGGTLAPGLLVPAAVSATEEALVTLDTGAERWDGGSAPARRVHLPFANADTTQMTADGQTLLLRAVEWAGGAGDGGGGGGGPVSDVVFEEFTEGRRPTPGGESVSISQPGGTAAGDLLIVAAATDGNTTSTLAPNASWNLTQLDLGHNGNGNVTFGVWWKIADGTEPANLIYSWTGSEHAYGWIMRFTGHDPGSPIATAATSTGDATDPLSTNLITSADGMLILRLGGFDDDDITVDVPGLPGHTVITMDRSGSAIQNTVSGGAGYAAQTTAGDTGTSNFALTKREQYRTLTLAIRPAP